MASALAAGAGVLAAIRSMPSSPISLFSWIGSLRKWSSTSPVRSAATLISDSLSERDEVT
jgi:hypothetical protein